MKPRSLLLVLIAVTALLTVFTAVASLLLLLWNHIAHDFAFPFYQWWVYLYLHLFVYRHTGLSIWLQFLVTGLFGAMLPVLCVRAWYIRHFGLRGPRLGSGGRIQDAIPSNSRAHGDANSMSLTQARRIFRNARPR